MSLRVSDLILFVLAGLAAGVMAGVAGVLLTGLLFAGPAGLALSVLVIGGAALIAIKWMALEAILVGAILWRASLSRPRLRRRRVWAAVGAVVGLAALPFPWPDLVDTALRASELGEAPPWTPLVFALAGAAGALAFRGTMEIGLAFVSDEVEA